MNRFQAHREPFTSGEKLLFASLPLGILAFVLSAMWLRRAEQAPQITFPTPVALPTPNGFDFYLAAANAILPAKPSVDPVDDRANLLSTNPKLAAKNYSLARRTAWLRANSGGFALVKQGLITPSRFDPNAGFGSFGKMRQLARSKVIEANTLILQGRWNDAAHSSLDTIQMGQDVARGGPLISRLVGSAIGAIGRDPLLTNRFVPEKLNATQARAAARRLEAILATRPSWKDALVQTKWATLTEFMGYVQKDNWRSLAQQGNTETTWKERLSTQFLSANEIARRISKSYDRSIEDVQKPYNAPIFPAPPLDPISSAMVSDSDYRFHEGREIVVFNTLLLRFALRAYRLENGEFPKKLSELAPKYLQSIPTDYFASGAPFRYRRNRKNYDLWSVGPDKVDNGGVPIKSREGKSGANENGRFPSILPDSLGDYVAAKNR